MAIKTKKPAPGPLAVEEWPLEKIVPYERNARNIPQSAIDKVAASLMEYGWQQPIVVDRKGVIVAGHTRRLAALKLGWTVAPVLVAAHLTAAQIKAYRLMDNRSHQEASWNDELLGIELNDLKALDFDLSKTGFDRIELDGLFTRITSVEEAQPDPDDVPEARPEPDAKPGDVWMLGNHRLMCGDSRDFGAVKELLDGTKANIVFTSPPYAEQREYDPSSGFRPIPPDEYVEWYRDVAANIRAVLAEDGSYFLNIKPPCEGIDTNLYVFDLVLSHVRELGFHFATEFCWERNGVPKSVTQRFKNQFEPIYQFVLGRWKMRPDAVRHESQNVPRAGGPGSGQTSWSKSQGGRGSNSVSGSFGAVKKRRNGTSHAISDIQGTSKDAGQYIGPGLAYPGNRLPTFAGTHEAKGHAAAFPVGLPTFFIMAFTDERDIAYDPFCGSGSTIIACEKSARKCYGMELSPAYCDVIVRRWENFTGKKAERA